tara:strand:- start:446 stop:1480 length:1035 start_codon:yes stop_codon:yes gene_type:complete
MILCSAITQIVYLDFKEYAVIDCSVEIAKKINKQHGFINALLNKIALDKNKLKKTKINYKVLPTWFKRETKNLSEFEKKSFVFEYCRKPNLHIVFKNDKYLSYFENEIIQTSNKSGFLKNERKIEDIPSFKSGQWWIQDYSSFVPLSNINENLISGCNLDICAAPGGKAFQILSRGKKIILNDSNKKRIRTLKKNLKRLKFQSKIENYDFKNIVEAKKYNFIIIDAPCSAIGTIRKNPEIFFRNKEPDFKKLVELQKNLLLKASKLLEKNGLILYMVCSFFKIETTDQIDNFLSNNKEFTIYNFPKKNTSKYDIIIKENLMQTLPTQINGRNIDGYFATYLKKN